MSTSMSIEAAIQPHVAAAMAGDRQAFARIVARVQNLVTSISLAITRDVAASEDVAQEALLRTWRGMHRLRHPASFLPWLRQVTRNLARDHLRGRVAGSHVEPAADSVIACAIDAQPGPDELALREEQVALAADLIAALPDDGRELLLLYYREGRSSRQVAELLGLPDAVVRKRLSRLRQGLRADLLERVGSFASVTAPSAAFTTAVSLALSASAPVAAAAPILGVAGSAGGKLGAKSLLSLLGSALLGMVLALGAIALATRKHLRAAIDDEERAGLKRSARVQGAASIGVVAMMLVAVRWTTGWVLPVLVTLAYLVVLVRQAAVVVPRVQARRHALEALRDPDGAARRRRRERLACWLGSILGTVFGLGGLVAGLVMSGRI